MKFSLVTPQQELLACDATHVVVPGEEGSFGVLDGHQPIVATMVPGPVTVDTADGTQTYIVGYGFADVSPEQVTLLAEDAVAAEAIDTAATQKQLDDLAGELAALTDTDPQRDLLTKRQAVLQARMQGGTPAGAA